MNPNSFTAQLCDTSVTGEKKIEVFLKPHMSQGCFSFFLSSLYCRTKTTEKSRATQSITHAFKSEYGIVTNGEFK